jgi:hypothetical protein
MAGFGLTRQPALACTGLDSRPIHQRGEGQRQAHRRERGALQWRRLHHCGPQFPGSPSQYQGRAQQSGQRHHRAMCVCVCALGGGGVFTWCTHLAHSRHSPGMHRRRRLHLPPRSDESRSRKPRRRKLTRQAARQQRRQPRRVAHPESRLDSLSPQKSLTNICRHPHRSSWDLS